MWTQFLALVAKVMGPRTAALMLQDGSAGDRGNIGVTSATTSDRIEIPDWLRGQFVKMCSLGCNTFVQFGGSAVDVVNSKANTLSTETVTFEDDVGFPVADGAYLDVIIPPAATHMAWEGDGDGTLHILPPGNQVVRQKGEPKL